MDSQTMTTASGAATGAVRQYRPSLRFYHPSMKGTGSAIELSLHPAHTGPEGDVDGSIMVKMANQVTVGNRMAPTPVFPRFDWEAAIFAKLGFEDLCGILQVLRGECESIGDGNGVWHRTAKGLKKIQFSHLIEPSSCYVFEVWVKGSGADDSSHCRFVFSAAEATGLCESIAGSMAVVSFGIPVVIPHDTSAYRAANRGVNRGVRDESAA